MSWDGLPGHPSLTPRQARFPQSMAGNAAKLVQNCTSLLPLSLIYGLFSRFSETEWSVPGTDHRSRPPLSVITRKPLGHSGSTEPVTCNPARYRSSTPCRTQRFPSSAKVRGCKSGLGTMPAKTAPAAPTCGLGSRPTGPAPACKRVLTRAPVLNIQILQCETSVRPSGHTVPGTAGL